jgi:hypothetical protein
MPLDLSRQEIAELRNLLVGAIENDYFPTSERVQRLRSILAKLRREMERADALTPGK